MKTRVRFSKHGKVRFTSHRDIARIWERALRRAGLPVAYTEGFSPRPKLSFGLALSTGFESEGEYLDVDLLAGPDHRNVDLAEVPARVDPALPRGLAVQVVAPVEPGTESLQQAVVSCSWRIEIVGPDPAAIAVAASRALDASSLLTTIERKGTEAVEDLRPGLIDLHVDPQEPVVFATLATQPRSVRPTDLVSALDASWHEGLVTRTHQWTLVDGAPREPLPLAAAAGATSTPHAQARAS